jgi:hypothetical protein
MRSTEDTTPSKAEQARLEEMWRESQRAYGEALRRQNCVEWISYHDRLSRGFRDHSERHERERDRYQRVLAKETGDTEEVCPR